MRLRMMALSAVCTVLLPLPGGLSDGKDSTAVEAGHRRCVKKRNCKVAPGKKDPPPKVEEREVALFLMATDLRYGFVDGAYVPVVVRGGLFDAQGNLVGAYEEFWDPIYDADDNFVGMNGVATWTFDGADPTLDGTLTSTNVSMFAGTDESGFFTLVQTTGEISAGTGDLAGTTGDVVMSTTAFLSDGIFQYDSDITLTLRTFGDDEEDPRKPRRRCQRARRHHVHHHRHHHRR